MLRQPLDNSVEYDSSTWEQRQEDAKCHTGLGQEAKLTVGGQTSRWDSLREGRHPGGQLTAEGQTSLTLSLSSGPVVGNKLSLHCASNPLQAAACTGCYPEYRGGNLEAQGTHSQFPRYSTRLSLRHPSEPLCAFMLCPELHSCVGERPEEMQVFHLDEIQDR